PPTTGLGVFGPPLPLLEPSIILSRSPGRLRIVDSWGSLTFPWSFAEMSSARLARERNKSANAVPTSAPMPCEPSPFHEPSRSWVFSRHFEPQSYQSTLPIVVSP